MLLLHILSGGNLNYVVLQSNKDFFFASHAADKNNEQQSGIAKLTNIMLDIWPT